MTKLKHLKIGESLIASPTFTFEDAKKEISKKFGNFKEININLGSKLQGNNWELVWTQDDIDLWSFFSGYIKSDDKKIREGLYKIISKCGKTKKSKTNKNLLGFETIIK